MLKAFFKASEGNPPTRCTFLKLPRRNPTRHGPYQVYISDDSIAELDPVSLVQKQTELVLAGQRGLPVTPMWKRASSHGKDVKNVSTLKLAFGPHYGQLTEWVGGIWIGSRVITVLELIGRLDEDIVFAWLP